MATFFKGYDKEHNVRHIFRMEDEPQDEPFGDGKYDVMAVNLGTGAHKQMMTEEAEKEFFIQREITADEFKLHYAMARLSTEIFMNQYTGGFPRENDAIAYEKQISQNLRKVLLNLFPRTEGGDANVNRSK